MLKLKNSTLAKASDPLQEFLNNFFSSINSVKKSQALQALDNFLDEQNNLRKDYQFGKKLKEFTNGSASFHNDRDVQQGVFEFGVSGDNEIFIVPQTDSSANNLYTLAQGTLLKAAGCIQMGNRQIEESVVGGNTYPKVLEGQVNYISVYNTCFDMPVDNIAVSLFALQRLGIDLSDTKVLVPDDNAQLINPITSDCKITVQGKIKKAEYYLDETRFPGAKALTEKDSTTEKNSIFFDKLLKLLCAIDDEILLKRNKKFLMAIYEEKELLKLNLIKLFSCAEKYINEVEKKAETKAITKSTELINEQEEIPASFMGYWHAIEESSEFLLKRNVNLSFLSQEINSLLAHIVQNSLTSEENDQLNELTTSASIPGRELNIETISPFVSFYEKDPIQTCIHLLRDYSKGQGLVGYLKRFFSLAWNRHHVSGVNQFLMEYDQQGLPDNITIFDIFNKLQQHYKVAITCSDKSSTLQNRLIFCAKLNGEELNFIRLRNDEEYDSALLSDQPIQPGTSIQVTRPESISTLEISCEKARSHSVAFFSDIDEKSADITASVSPSP
ncbi:MAG: DUF5617 domain-containing protein [Candidatus Aquirickettsiella sp.]